MMKLLDFEVGINQPFFLIAGPCVIESEALALETAAYLKQVTEDLGINFIYKSSYDKANRTSTSSFRGLGIEEGLRILQKVKDEVGCKVLTAPSLVVRLRWCLVRQVVALNEWRQIPQDNQWHAFALNHAYPLSKTDLLVI
jgi:hypothetical protein